MSERELRQWYFDTLRRREIGRCWLLLGVITGLTGLALLLLQ